MMMMPFCSASPTSCSSSFCPHSQIPNPGGFKSLLSPYSKTFYVNYNNVGKLDLNFMNRGHIGIPFFKRQAFLTRSSYQVAVIDESHRFEPNGLVFVDDSSVNFTGEEQLSDFIGKVNDPEIIPPSIGLPVDPPLADSLNYDVNPLSSQETDFSGIVSGVNESTADTINGVRNVLSNSFDTITSSVTTTLTNTHEAVDNAKNALVSFLSESGNSAGNKLAGLSGGLKEASGKAGFVALDVLRGAILVIEDSLVKGAKTVGYGYSSAKELLPPDFRGALSLSEESVLKVVNPVGGALQQVYVAVEGFEENLGLDPNDPLIPFVVFLGLSATVWGSFRVLKYSGYAGDLSPQATFELLRGNEKVVLVDIRPENLREKDGIPDLRRTARFRYASVTLPEIDNSVKKLLKGGRELEDSLIAAVVRNLKNVEGRSKVLVMDADGTRSKGVARSLRKLGIKRPYLVQGGFRSWAKEGFRVKMLKPETAITILNEEAEAILEEINPTPLKVLGFGAGLVAAAYSVAEWEKTLQFIGVIGVGQTIYRRLATYQDAEDFKQDVRLLLAPVRIGGQAVTWAAGKLETNRNGLPTSPSSSSDVQSRVLQAAAKHESQPSDGEETQDSQTVSSGNENVNISEA